MALKNALRKNEYFVREGAEWRIGQGWREVALGGVGSRRGRDKVRFE